MCVPHSSDKRKILLEFTARIKNTWSPYCLKISLPVVPFEILSKPGAKYHNYKLSWISNTPTSHTFKGSYHLIPFLEPEKG